MITPLRATHAIVLNVNMLSFIIAYVRIGKIKLLAPKPTSFDVHNSPLSSTIYLAAYQKHIPIGTANISCAVSGRSFHQGHANCELNWNHAIMFPRTKNRMP